MAALDFRELKVFFILLYLGTGLSYWNSEATVNMEKRHSPVPTQSQPQLPITAATNEFDDFLVDMPPSADSSAPQLTPGAEEGFMRFVCKNRGVLFKNKIIRIGLKSEFKQNLARIRIFFGNECNSNLVGFTSEVYVSPVLAETSITVQTKPAPNTIDAGTQIQQLVICEAHKAFFEAPLLKVRLTVGGVAQSLVVKLPLMIHKFSEPVEMSSTDFFQKWKSLPSANEAQKIFPAQFPIEKEAIETKLKGCQLSVLSNIDPNPDNFVSAAILNTKNSLIGVLLRLEPKKQKKKYRLTIRSSCKEVSDHLLKLLSEQF